MSLFEAMIPGIVGVLLVLRPDSMFVGSRAQPTEAKIALLRKLGWVLLAISVLFMVLAVFSS